MSEYALEARPRLVLGKQVKQLRRQGQVPGVIYGVGFEPLPISVDHKQLRQTLLKAGGAQVINIQVGQQTIPTIARDVQRDHIRESIVHVDFQFVRMDVLIRAEVPLLFVNESPAVADREAIAHHIINSVEVEALPGDLPAHIEVDMSRLTAVGQSITIGELLVSPTVKIHGDPQEAVLRLEHVVGAADEEDTLFVEAVEAPEVIGRKHAEEVED